MKEALICHADIAVISKIQTRLRLEISHLPIVNCLHLRSGNFRHDVFHVPLEPLVAVILFLECFSFLQRLSFLPGKVCSFELPAVRGGVEVLLPVFHPQFGYPHLILLDDYFPISIERVRKWFEDVAYPRTGMVQHLQSK